MSLIGVIGSAARRRGGAPLLLDISPAALAFSFRLLRADYSGPCCRIRRASDNAQLDIGFSAGIIDTAALESFCAATDGHIVTWYDQGGSEWNATQATTGQQPRVVVSGATVLQEGNVSAQFAAFASNASMTFPLAAMGVFRNREHGELAYVIQETGTALRTIGGFLGSSFARFHAEIGRAGTGRMGLGGRRLDSDAFTSLAASAAAGAALRVASSVIAWGTATAEVREQGDVTGSGTFLTAGSTSDTNSATGRIGVLFTDPSPQHISEFVVYNTNVSATAAIRDAERMAFYYP
jgi:hypothetical protein